jgi:enoyl-CoA hydratase/carnithine racemase
MPDILYDRYPAGHYAIFKMNRPDRLNAQGAAMRDDLAAAMEEFTLDPEMRVGIVTGEGRAFSAGADLREMAERNAASGQSQTQAPPPETRVESGRLGQPFARNPKPFIAAINGLAIAAGMERAADCDIRIASTEAYFGLFEVKRGILPGYAMHNLARVMPFGDAMYLMLTGDTMSVTEAHRLGFVHEVLEPQQLMVRAVEIAEMIGANAPLAVQGTKAVAQYWRRLGLEESARLGAWVAHYTLNSEDAKEGPLAFAEKRTAVWKGR